MCVGDVDTGGPGPDGSDHAVRTSGKYQNVEESRGEGRRTEDSANR